MRANVLFEIGNAWGGRKFCLPAALLVILTILSFNTFAQDDDDFDPNAAPPPVKAMSKGEREQLESRTDVKDHTKLALELMDARLTRAQSFNEKGEFREMYDELGGFHALMDNTLDYLYHKSRRDKVLDTFKKFEMALRSFAPRLGLIRREIPIEFDHYVRVLLKYLRDARTKAVEPLFGDSVVPNRRTS